MIRIVRVFLFVCLFVRLLVLLLGSLSRASLSICQGGNKVLRSSMAHLCSPASKPLLFPGSPAVFYLMCKHSRLYLDFFFYPSH